jgi:heat shock protein 5
MVCKGNVEIIANDQGHRITPSYGAFDEGETLVGETAKNRAATNPENTVCDAKRLIGRRFERSSTRRYRSLVLCKLSYALLLRFPRNQLPSMLIVGI